MVITLCQALTPLLHPSGLDQLALPSNASSNSWPGACANQSGPLIEFPPCSCEMVLAPDGTRPSREPCDDPVETKSMWPTIKAVAGHRAQHITTGKTPSVACVVAASGIQATFPPGLESVLLAGVRRPGAQRWVSSRRTMIMNQLLTDTSHSHLHVEPRIIPRPLRHHPATSPTSTMSAIAMHSQIVNSQQPSGCGSTAAGSDADSRVDEDDSGEEKYLARPITGCLSEHEFNTSLPSPRTFTLNPNIALLTCMEQDGTPAELREIGGPASVFPDTNSSLYSSCI